MFERPHHRRIATLLATLDAALLAQCECYFGGGTAISLLLGEHRESVDVDFLCASTSGYRELRQRVFSRGLAGLARGPMKELRELRSDQYGIRTFVEVDATPIKFEIVREARISLTGENVESLPVAVLSKEDLFAEKLLANTDRVMDRATHNRDALDLGVMVLNWGPIPPSAWDKARAAYGDTVERALSEATRRLDDSTWLTTCAHAMQMPEDDAARALAALKAT